MATVKFYLKNPKANGMLRADEVSIVLKFTLSRGQRFEITTGEKIIPKFWDTIKQQVKSNHRRHVEMNQSLRKIQEEVIQLWRDNRTADAQTLRNLAEPLIRFVPTEEKKTVIEAVDKFLAQYAKEKEESSLPKYQALRKRLNEYSTGHKLAFETMDMNFLDAFKNYLYALPNPNYRSHSLNYSDSLGCYVLTEGDSGSPVGLFDEVVFKYIINLKTVLAWCEERGYPVNPSYKKWKVIKREYPVISLTKEELDKLETVNFRPLASLTVSPGATNREREIDRKVAALEVARDYLVAECRTGQRIGDIMRFDIKDVKDNRWTFNPKKGSRTITKTVTVPFTGFCAPAYWIFQKHNFKMPKISNQKLNENIKEALKAAGIDKEIYEERWAGNKRIRIYGPKYRFASSHNGRKTFITIALQFMTAAQVMDIVGIRSFKTMRHYQGETDVTETEKGLNRIESNEKTVMKKAQ